MSLFGLHPAAVQARVANATKRPRLLTLAQSVVIGGLGFGIVGVIAFAVWAFAGRWLYIHWGNGGLYLACAVVFMGLAGFALHFLVIGPGALWRFYLLFAAAFFAYSIAWCAAWFALQNKVGEWSASFAGALVCALVLTSAFSARAQWIKIALILFVPHSAGYFAGELAYESFGHKPNAEVFGIFLDKSKLTSLGMMFWGFAYGVGFGVGLGWALHSVQSQIRARLQQRADGRDSRAD